jgi:hypothetical protein
MLLWVLSHKQIQLPLYAFLQLIRYITVGTTLHIPLYLTLKSSWFLATSLVRLKKNIFLVNISQFLKDSCFWEGSQLSSVLDIDERGRLVEFMWSDFIIYVKWCYFEVKWSEVSYGAVLGDKSAMYIRVILYWGYLIVLWLFHLGISCTVFVLTCTVVVLTCW